VRIHTGADSVQMNRELGAQAFTHGRDIYFNEGKYNPSSPDGQRLLAHELTHVVQQGAAGEFAVRRARQAQTTLIQRNVVPGFDEILSNPEYLAHFKQFADQRFTPESYQWPLARKQYKALWQNL